MDREIYCVNCTVDRVFSLACTVEGEFNCVGCTVVMVFNCVGCTVDREIIV